MLPGMAKRGMPDVMDQGQCFGEVGVQFQPAGDGAGDLCHFQGMREPIAEMVGKESRENLSFSLKPPECPAMSDSASVPSIVIAVGMAGFGPAAASGARNVHGVRSQSHERILCQPSARTKLHAARKPCRSFAGGGN